MRVCLKKKKKEEEEMDFTMSSDVGFYAKFIPCRISFDLLSRIELSACV